KVVKYDSADQIVAALTTVAQANENMASAILNSPAPSGLKADELETYRKELQKVADPFLKNAHENYQLAYRRGLELGAYTDWMLIAGQGLRKYDANAGANETESIPIDQSVDLMGI